MATDIVPVLYSRITKAFKKRVEGNKEIQNIKLKLAEGEAAALDIYMYAEKLGQAAAEVLAETLDPENLPERQLHWNIGNRTITPLLKEVFGLVMAAAGEKTKAEDEVAELHMGPQEPDFPQDKVDDLLFKLKEYLEEDIDG